MELTIRPARPEDLASLARLLTEAFREELTRIFGVEGARLEATMTALLGADDGAALRNMLVAVADGQVVGTLSRRHRGSPHPRDGAVWQALVRNLGVGRTLRSLVVAASPPYTPRPDELHVSDVAVARPWRRRGIARRLMAAVEEEARRLGLRRLTLFVDRGNEPALALYRALGYRPLPPTFLQRLFWKNLVRMGKEVRP